MNLSLKGSISVLAESTFNNDLDRIPASEKNINIPKIVVDCIETLESRPDFMSSNGLYRASGNHSLMQQLRIDVSFKTIYLQYKLFDLTIKTIVIFQINNCKFQKIRDLKDPFTIAGILKLFLRELKSPLLSYKQLVENIPHLKDFPNDHYSVKYGKLEKLVQCLPTRNRETLKYLVTHLARYE